VAIVTAHGVSAHSHVGGEASRRLQQAMEQAIAACNADGISNEEHDAPIIRRAMRVAHQRELLAITKEEHLTQMRESSRVYSQRLAELTRAHQAHLTHVEAAYRTEVARIEASIAELG
jgi:hypothetical protein